MDNPTSKQQKPEEDSTLNQSDAPASSRSLHKTITPPVQDYASSKQKSEEEQPTKEDSATNDIEASDMTENMRNAAALNEYSAFDFSMCPNPAPDRRWSDEEVKSLVEFADKWIPDPKNKQNEDDADKRGNSFDDKMKCDEK